MEELKLDIKEQISKTNQAFTNYWGEIIFGRIIE